MRAAAGPGERSTIMTAFHRVLVAADFSESSRQAFQVACALAGGGQTRLFVVHVLEPEYAAEEPVYLGQQNIRYVPAPRQAAELEPFLEHLRKDYAPAGPLEAVYQVKEGRTAEEILRSATELGCDLIVMGTHGRTGLRRLLMGSVAEALMRAAACPVLAVKVPDPAPDAAADPSRH
jgi:nucleotide-binding universal stress UspA family protein